MADITAPRDETVEYAVEFTYNNPLDDKNSGRRYEHMQPGTTLKQAKAEAKRLDELVVEGGDFWSDVVVLSRTVPGFKPVK